jgi:ribose/xylose/arabinose/galactoside ABC-type transport system permease subunit
VIAAVAAGLWSPTVAESVQRCGSESTCVNPVSHLTSVVLGAAGGLGVVCALLALGFGAAHGVAGGRLALRLFVAALASMVLLFGAWLAVLETSSLRI